MRVRQLAFMIILAIMGPPLRAESIVVDHDRIEALEALCRDRFISLDREAKVIRLARSYLITNEMGVTGQFFDRLGKDDCARVRFTIPLSGFDRASLLIYTSYTYKGNHPLWVAVNGRRRPYIHDESRMLTGGWARHDLAADELKPGDNEITIGGAGGLHVDTWSHTGRSARSFDGGATFKPDQLGSDGSWSGEYIVRLRVYGYPGSGEVSSPVIDPAVWPVDPRVRPKVSIRKVTLRPRQDVPEGTCVQYAVRTGTTPAIMGRTWTNWEAVEPERPVSVPGQRYLQWRATLKTSASRLTPAISSVRVDLDADVVRPDMKGARVDVYEAPVILASSYPFTWESDTPRIRHLREKYALSDVIRPADGELTGQWLLRRWVSRQWDKGWDEGAYRYVPPWDGLELLELAPRHLSLGMCTHYSCTFVQTATAVGYTARSLIADHHCLAEAWSNPLGKWILQDTGPGPGPKGHPVSFAYQSEGKWLNALEVHRALLARRPVMAVPYNDLKGPYRLDDQWMGLFIRFAVPLRNNHLSEPWPAEIEHGHEQYRWDGYLWWTDSVDDPKYPEYSLQSDRVADFYGALNQVAVDLQCRDARTLSVGLDSQTPNLAGYEAAVDDGAWGLVKSGFPWARHSGVNRLRVRAVNAFGLAGRPTAVVLTEPSDR
jgi:hypothetical protein